MAAIDTEEVRERLAQLTRDGNGKLTPEAVVDDARHSKSPLHPLFNDLWDDATAARRTRIERAREIIRTVRVRIVITDDVVLRPIAYVRDPTADADEAGYVSTLRVVKSNDTDKAAVLDDEVQRVTDLINSRIDILRAIGKGDLFWSRLHAMIPLTVCKRSR